MKSNYSIKRRLRIKNLNLGKNLSNSTKELMSEKASKRPIEILKQISLKLSKPVEVYFKSGEFFKEFAGVKITADYFKADHRTITKHLTTEKLFKNTYFLKYKKKD